MSGSIVEEVEDPYVSEGIGKVASDGDPADGDECGVILLACSNALANACILPKRRCGSFSSAVSTTCSSVGEMVGMCSDKEGGGVSTCWLAISAKEP